MSIFKAYDIRGTVPDQFDEERARRIANAYARFLGAKRVVVGRDCRIHSAGIAQATVDGLRDSGADVIDIGACTTPMSYFAVGRLEADGGLMVTASHNPPKYNGFKLCREGARPISGETGIEEIRTITESGAYLKAAKRGGIKGIDVSEDYAAHVRRFAGKPRPLKVVVDGGNGMAGAILPRIVAGWPIQLTALYLEPDGRFPNHEPNPLKPENTAELCAKVKAVGADLGIAFDGDADRCGVVDERGERVGADIITALIAADFLDKTPGAAIVYDLRSSMVVREEIEKRGGKPVEERVGHSFLKATMRRVGAVFGGELSGHYYFRDNYFADSAMIAFARILDILGSSGRRFSELLAPLRRTFPTGELNFHVEDKEARIEAVARTFADAQQSRLDGLTVRYPHWWANVRMSNTEPVLRLNLEGRTEAAREEGKRRMLALLGDPES